MKKGHIRTGNKSVDVIFDICVAVITVIIHFPKRGIGPKIKILSYNKQIMNIILILCLAIIACISAF